jgi:hypothetical protein
MYSSTFLHLATRWRWVVSFTPLKLYPRGTSPQYQLDRRLGGPQSRSGCCGEEKKLALPGIEPRPSLYRLSYPDFSVGKYGNCWLFTCMKKSFGLPTRVGHLSPVKRNQSSCVWYSVSRVCRHPDSPCDITTTSRQSAVLWSSFAAVSIHSSIHRNTGGCLKSHCRVSTGYKLLLV